MIKIITVNANLSTPASRPSDYLTPQVDGLRRFTVTLPIPDSPKKLPGAVECSWFDDVGSAVAAHGCADFAELVAPGAQRWAARENVVIPGPAGPFPATSVKMVAFLQRHDDYGVEAFQRYWRENHAPLVPRTPKVRRYVQSHFLLEHYEAGQPSFDGVAELWWDSIEDYEISWASPEIQHEQMPDTARFLGTGSFTGMGVEIVLRDDRST
jgi:uncharacterized protein (TIGR02118 family)